MNRTRSRPVRKPAHDSVKASCPSGLNQILANPAYTADSKMFMGWTKVGYRTNALAWFNQYRQSPLFWGGIHGILDCWPTYRMRLPEGASPASEMSLWLQEAPAVKIRTGACQCSGLLALSYTSLQPSSSAHLRRSLSLTYKMLPSKRTAKTLNARKGAFQYRRGRCSFTGGSQQDAVQRFAVPQALFFRRDAGQFPQDFLVDSAHLPLKGIVSELAGGSGRTAPAGTAAQASVCSAKPGSVTGLWQTGSRPAAASSVKRTAWRQPLSQVL